MGSRLKVWQKAFAVIALACIGLTLAAAPAVSIDVRPRRAMAPGAFMVTVRTPRDDRNRKLRIAIDGANYYRGTYEEMTGDSPIIRRVIFEHIPGGWYYIVADLLQNNGETQHAAPVKVCVIGMIEDCGDSDVEEIGPVAPSNRH